MAKKEVRVIEAPENVVAMIDKGVNTDIEMKNLTFTDKACKEGITQFVEKQIEEDETSVLIEGTKAKALVSKAQSMEIETGSEQFPELQRFVKAGILEGVVSCNRKLVVPPAKLDEAVEILRKAGMEAAIVEDYGVKAADLRKHKELRLASQESQEATEALEGCVSTKTTYRVKYEAYKAQGE